MIPHPNAEHNRSAYEMYSKISVNCNIHKITHYHIYATSVLSNASANREIGNVLQIIIKNIINYQELVDIIPVWHDYIILAKKFSYDIFPSCNYEEGIKGNRLRYNTYITWGMSTIYQLVCEINKWFTNPDGLLNVIDPNKYNFDISSCMKDKYILFISKCKQQINLLENNLVNNLSRYYVCNCMNNVYTNNMLQIYLSKRTANSENNANNMYHIDLLSKKLSQITVPMICSQFKAEYKFIMSRIGENRENILLLLICSMFDTKCVFQELVFDIVIHISKLILCTKRRKQWLHRKTSYFYLS